MGLLSNDIKPVNIRLEASSRCQLRCPSCPTTTKAIHPAVGTGVLKLSDFKSLLEANPVVRSVELSNYGEVFLNPELLDILRLADMKGVALSIHNGANLNHLTDEVAEGLVKYRIQEINCSIDGASQETYVQYRKGGNYDRVIENIKRINRFKQSYGSELPRLNWQFIVFGHNEHEIPRAKEMARELGMSIAFKLNWDAKFSPIRNPDRVREQAGLTETSREEHKARRGYDYTQGICTQLWDRPQINWDGKNLGCCRNFWGDFGGNAFTDGLVATVNHEKMKYARAMLMGRKPPRVDIPCSTCGIYQGMGTRGKLALVDLLVRPRLKYWKRVILGVAQKRR
jgi:MoaA/NifB/PqqE/SkfB family radical SAM enzyme